MNRAASSKSNLLLAALAPDDYALLRPHLTQVHLQQHAVLQDPGQPIEHIFFPLEGVVSVVAIMPSSETIEIAAIGHEGAIGTKVGLNPQLAFAKALVQLPGSALRIDIRKFQQAAKQSVAITHLATCATDVMTANVQQAAACNAMHPIEVRLARWLLHARDRFDSDELPLTQEFLSQMLGVRSTTVSLTAKTLQNAGLIEYRRGRVRLTDRAGLQKASCDCYGAMRHNIELILETAKLAADPQTR
jgi:CRP-like cAMP-binding protein